MATAKRRNKPAAATEEFAFYERLWDFYFANRKKIRSRYNDLTKRILDYNDREKTPGAFLRPPQFEALEMYVFIKEFLNNPHIDEVFDDWRNQRGKFAEGYYAINRDGEIALFDEPVKEQNEAIFEQMKKYRAAYPNYIYALTMGLGKTILMATCIFYEFLLANKFSKDTRFCHNALIFAPDKTVLESLREAITFPKEKVIPPEYVSKLDSLLKVYYLDEAGMTLPTLDDSDFNIIISNNQKIIIKTPRSEMKPAEKLFINRDSAIAALFAEEVDNNKFAGEVDNNKFIFANQRLQKLARLKQLGVYVDEAHHLFGAELEKESTALRNTIDALAEETSLVACYNYTGTPYVDRQLLPEVVYAYGLKAAIASGYLKDADVKGYENVKDEEFLRQAITAFWQRYGGKTYEGLFPKLAIYAASVDEANDTVRPLVEKIIGEMGLPADSILVNVGDEKITRDSDIRDFNNLDVPGTAGSKKQFIILVGKGKEGWNCRSLLGVALFRKVSASKKIFVLQATMRCMRKLTDEQLTASVFLSKENFDILDEELHKNFKLNVGDIGSKAGEKKERYKIRVLPPPRYIKLKKVIHSYETIEKAYSVPLDFKLSEIDEEKYKIHVHERESIRFDDSVSGRTVESLASKDVYSLYLLVGEIARRMNLSCLLIERILRESVDTAGEIVAAVNRHNQILDDVIIPTIFHALFEVRVAKEEKDVDVLLLKKPEEADCYEFLGKPSLTVKRDEKAFTDAELQKSFHADTYCFDSEPEKICFEQYITNKHVREIYFTGMFTAGQGDLSVWYFDPETNRMRKYYPDFLARMDDGSYRLIEVKADFQIDDEVVKAKAAAAREMAVASGIEYIMYAGSRLMKENVLNESPTALIEQTVL